MPIVHPTAHVDPEARIGDDVRIGAFTVVGPLVEVGDGTIIDSHCLIGHQEPGTEPAPLRLGARSRVRSHSVLYTGSTIGPGLETGHHVTIREDMEIGPNLRVGTLSDLQGHARIGKYVRLHSNVHIGQESRIGDYVWIFPYTVLTNDPHPPSDGFLAGATVEDYAVIATRTTVLPGLTIGRDAFVGAATLVNRDVPPGRLIAGIPGRDRGAATDIELGDTGSPAYPWRRHFRRGFPDDVVASWEREFDED